MVKVTLHTPGYAFLSIIQFLVPFSAMCAYVVVVGDTVTRVIAQLALFAGYDAFSFSVGVHLVKVASVVFVMLPLSLLKNISWLEKFSAFSLLCMCVMLCTAIYEGIQTFCAVRCFTPRCCTEAFTLWGVSYEILQAVGIMSFAFTCHHNTFLIYASLRNRTLARYTILTHVAMATTFTFYMSAGLSGFVPYMREVQGNLLNNYCISDIPAIIARLFYATVIMLTYPIQSLVCREVAEVALSKIPHKLLSRIPAGTVRKALEYFFYAPRNKSLARRIVLTVFFVTLSLGIGLSTEDLGMILALFGNFFCIPIIFILPTASFLRLSKCRWCSSEKLSALAVMVLGITLTIVGTAQSIVQVIESYSHREHYIPDYCLESSADTTCCQLLESTENFTLSVPLCDCVHFCENTSFIHQC